MKFFHSHFSATQTTTIADATIKLINKTNEFEILTFVFTPYLNVIKCDTRVNIFNSIFQSVLKWLFHFVVGAFQF